MRKKEKINGWFALAAVLVSVAWSREFNGPYEGANLNRVAFPIGGLGAGMYCLEGPGAISHLSVRHRMEFFNEPTCFAAVCVLGEKPGDNVARVLEGPVPKWKCFGPPGAANGAVERTYGFPRFRACSFLARFPFATVTLSDPALPLAVELTGWSPFTPPDPDPSSLPAGVLEYRMKNTSGKAVRAVFSFNTRNFMGNKGSVGPLEGGFVLYGDAGESRGRNGAFAFFVEDPDVRIDHCWFRGWDVDSLTLAWNNVSTGRALSNPPVSGSTSGASLAVPFTLGPGEERTIRLHTCWYVPESGMRINNGQDSARAPAFRAVPSKGASATQQAVGGFLGKGLVNTFDPNGDCATGTLTSPEFVLNKRYLHFLIGGGNCPDKAGVSLLIGGKAVRSATGKNAEALEWRTFDLMGLAGAKGRIRIADLTGEMWGHINADHFILSDEPVGALKTGGGNAVTDDASRVILLADFEGNDYGAWVADPPAPANDATEKTPAAYVPWYATQFKSIQAVAAYWRAHCGELRARSAKFRDAFYDTTLPPEAVEAVAANLTILKSPTVLRQHDGRLWCWEGCGDNGGSCAGSCTHVWNYDQAVCNLFPSLARGMRRTSFFEGLDEKGRQAYRANLPITPGGQAFDAADGHLGEIMKAHREWRISGDREWLKTLWPKVRLAMDYAVAKWDPHETGLPEEEQFNTYDISYFGANSHIGSLYLGALAAATRMGETLGEDVSRDRALLAKGRERMEKELFNGEYFVQSFSRTSFPLRVEEQSEAYREIAKRINGQGPKYQYGTGCLSDGVLGFWMARMCGIEGDLIDPAKVKRHLLSVYTYNLRRDLSAHANPQRPSFAIGNDGGLLLCSWPRGDKPLIPFVYSDEVWTGIEYQAAAHLIMIGEVEKGLEIVRTCRRRYDGEWRNPFDEYECGHWYARALSSYALIEAFSGVSYDAADKALRVRTGAPRSGRSFLCTGTGFGTVAVRRGVPSVTALSGTVGTVRD